MIISASRRTDIPALYGEWFINRIKAGFVYVRNPFNYHAISKIVLRNDLVDVIVFWTKDSKNFLDKLDYLDEVGYKYYFQFTLNPYDKTIEQALRDKNEIIDSFKQLSRKIGREKVIWRYDPILIDNEIGINYHLKEFKRLAKILGEFSETVTISFLDEYKKLGRPIYRSPSLEEMMAIGEEFGRISGENGLKINTCAEEILFNNGISKASCIDSNLISKILGQQIVAQKDKNQRKECLCIESIDIGEYDSCMHFCQYCYANSSSSKILNNNKMHDPHSPLLIGNVTQIDIIKEREVKSLKTGQFSFF